MLLLLLLLLLLLPLNTNASSAFASHCGSQYSIKNTPVTVWYSSYSNAGLMQLRTGGICSASVTSHAGVEAPQGFHTSHVDVCGVLVQPQRQIDAHTL
jgi:hypothetical protein